MREEIIGMVVTAKAGRDKGRNFVIVGTEGDEFALIADGKLRKTEKPKKKKLKHLSFGAGRIGFDGVPEESGSRNAFIRRELERMSHNDNTASEEV